MAQGEDIHTADPDGWGAWRRHVLLEMESQRGCIEKLTDELVSMKVEMKSEIAVLKYKSTAWGAVGAGVVVLLYVLVEVVKNTK